MGSPVIFKGKKAKLLPSDGFEMQSGKGIIDLQSMDPTSGGGYTAPVGSIGMSAVGGGTFYVKTGVGDTAWTTAVVGTATSANTPNTIVKRNGTGGINIGGLNASIMSGTQLTITGPNGDILFSPGFTSIAVTDSSSAPGASLALKHTTGTTSALPIGAETGDLTFIGSITDDEQLFGRIVNTVVAVGPDETTGNISLRPFQLGAETNALTVYGSTGRTGIQGLDINMPAGGDAIDVFGTSPTAAPPVINIQNSRSGATIQDGDTIGTINFRGVQETGSLGDDFAQINVVGLSPNPGSGFGQMDFNILSDGDFARVLRLSSDGASFSGFPIVSSGNITNKWQTAANSVANQWSSSVGFVSSFWNGGSAQDDIFTILSKPANNGTNPEVKLFFDWSSGSSGAHWYSFNNAPIEVVNVKNNTTPAEIALKKLRATGDTQSGDDVGVVNFYAKVDGNEALFGQFKVVATETTSGVENSQLVFSAFDSGDFLPFFTVGMNVAEFTNIKVTSGMGVGKIAVSDANGLLNWTDPNTVARTVFGSKSVPESIVAATGITSAGGKMSTTIANQDLWVVGSVAGDSVCATITAGTVDGQVMTILGTSNANTLTLNSTTTNVELNGPMTLGLNSKIQLRWDGTNWSENWRR